MRGVPNSALRGALFAAIQGKTRTALKRKLLETPQGIEIRFTGWQLDQSDLDVWEQALHLARQHPLGSRCHFTAHGFLKALGRKTGGKDHEWLKEAFARLTGCAVEITHNRLTYVGNLLEFFRDEDTSGYVVELNPKMVALYTAGWTATDWEVRLALKGKPLALWLYGFYASHADPRPLRIETIHKLCGSKNKDLLGFKRDLLKACKQVQEAEGIRGFEVKNGLLFVGNFPSDSQRRHLRRKALVRKTYGSK